MPASSSVKPNHANVVSLETQFGPLANSERIQLRFGNYSIDIIENNSSIRVSSLYSTHDGVRIIRTVAVVAYPNVIEKAFRKEHDAIVNGQSIGTLFKNKGWEIEKRHQYFGEIETSNGLFSEAANRGGKQQTRSAIHVYTLVVRKDNTNFEYASIAEVHHPEFLQLDDLAAIYGSDFGSHQGEKEKPGSFLNIVKSRINALSRA
jgi:hypothetical protein